jgi:hypothetical protein
VWRAARPPSAATCAARHCVGLLHDALGGSDASTLPALLAATHRYLPGHPELASRIDAVTTRSERIRREPRQRPTTGGPDGGTVG